MIFSEYNFLEKNVLSSLKYNHNPKKKTVEIKTVFQNKIEIFFKYNLNSVKKNNKNFTSKILMSIKIYLMKSLFKSPHLVI